MKARPTPSVDDLLKTSFTERGRGCLYTRVLFRAGQKTPDHWKCFNDALGYRASWNPDHNCEFSDTNMLQPEILSPPYDLIATRFLFVFEPDSPDASAFVRSYSWRFHILQKAFGNSPVLTVAVKGRMSKLLEGFPPEYKPGKYPAPMLQPMARPFTFDCGQNAKYIPPLTPFYVSLNGTPIKLAADLNFYVVIDGTLNLSVQ